MRPSMSICTPRACPSFGQELRVREARADHQQRVAVRHQVPARLRAEQADRAGDERQVVGQRPPCRAAPWRRRRRAASATCDHLVGRVAARPRRPASRPSRRRSARRRRAADRRRAGTIRGARVADAGVDRAVRARRRLDGVSSCRSFGMMMQVTRALGRARCGSRGRRDGGPAPGAVAICTYSCATSLNSDGRSTSCW